MTHEMQILAALNLSLILQLVGLIFAVNVDSYIGKAHKRLLAIVIVLVFSLIIQSQAESYFDANAMIFPRTVASVYGYAVCPIVIIVFIQLFYQGKNMLWLWTLAAINAAEAERKYRIRVRVAAARLSNAIEKTAPAHFGVA